MMQWSAHERIHEDPECLSLCGINRSRLSVRVCVCQYYHLCASVDVLHNVLCLLQEGIMDDVREHFTRTLRHGGRRRVSVQ